MKFFLLLCAITFAVVFSSCSDSTSTNTTNTTNTTSIDASKEFPGTWNMTYVKNGFGTFQASIDAGSNQLTFGSVVYDITYSGATINGSRTYTLRGMTLTDRVTITMKSKTTVEGVLNAIAEATFTGVKK